MELYKKLLTQAKLSFRYGRSMELFVNFVPTRFVL